eukprot:EG_transcript_8355
MPVARPRSASTSASRRPRPGTEAREAEGFEAVEPPALTVPLSARPPVAMALALGAFPEIQPAVVAPPEEEAAVGVAEGSVVEDPTKVALRLIRETFTPFVIVKAQANVFVVHVRIAEGMHSAVFQVEDRQQEKVHALKVVPLTPLLKDAWLGTALLLRRLRHRHIVHCFEHFQYVTQRVPFLCLKLQSCLRGSLADHLRRSRKPLGGSLTVAYITQLASALQYLHQQGILHGDLRADHVLLATHDEEVRLTGLTHSLGLRRRAPGRRLTVTGGPQLYAPPEWVESAFLARALHPTETPLPSYDMWALGCLLAELCTGRLLEDRQGLHGPPLALDATALEEAQQRMETAHRGAFARLGQGLLDVDPETRLTAEEALRAARSSASKVGFWSTVMAKVSRQS